MNTQDIVITAFINFFEKNDIRYNIYNIYSNDDLIEYNFCVNILRSDNYYTNVINNCISLYGNIEYYYDNMIKDISIFVNNYIDNFSYFALADIRNEITKLKDKYIKNRSIFNQNVDRLNITYDFDWVYCDHKIPLQMVQYKNKKHFINSDCAVEKGYIINSFKFDNRHIFDGVVYCDGTHPNVDSIDGRLCSDTGLSCRVITVDLIISLITMLSIANLDRCYDFNEHYAKLKGLFL